MSIENSSMMTFGPVPSRRLGRSIGINNIQAKRCTYSCGYCQAGRTTCLQKDPADFHHTGTVFREVEARLSEARMRSEKVDYITFVPNGEPSLDLGLGREIELVRSLGIPVAVITNGSLLWRDEIREALSLADWVSVKVDTVVEPLWRRVNRPEGSLLLQNILGGIRVFAREYRGVLVTETMLIGGMNDTSVSVSETARFIREIDPSKAFISIPVRPPMEERFRIPSPSALGRAFEIFSSTGMEVEMLQDYEGDAFTSTSDVRTDILGITSVHPMGADAMRHLLSSSGAGWDLVEQMVSAGELVR